jgi:hypothetical protein
LALVLCELNFFRNKTTELVFRLRGGQTFVYVKGYQNGSLQ